MTPKAAYQTGKNQVTNRTSGLPAGDLSGAVT